MIAVAILVCAFLAGAMAGVILLLRTGIAREETDFSLRGKPATRAAAVTRRMVGLYARTPTDDLPPDDTANLMDTRPLSERPGR
jgi:hypothetical protein